MDHNWIQEFDGGKYNVKYNWSTSYDMFICTICNLVKIYDITDNYCAYYVLFLEGDANYLEYHEHIIEKGIDCNEHLINKILL